MLEQVDVLDHGYVRLVDVMGDDLSIVRSARVSYDADWRDGDDKKDERLIAYLMKNRHTSPFEAVTFTFEVKAPIFVFRQWHRHRTWSYNEVSARYTKLPEEVYIPDVHTVGVQSEHNKQMRIFDSENNPEGNFEKAKDACTRMRLVYDLCFKHYHELLNCGVPRELARSVLPMATYSRMFATVDLHNLFHFIRLRLHEHAQYEIRVYAEAMLQLIEPLVPVAVREFRKTL